MAENTRTGIVTNPKLIDPVQIARAIQSRFPYSRRAKPVSPEEDSYSVLAWTTGRRPLRCADHSGGRGLVMVRVKVGRTRRRTGAVPALVASVLAVAVSLALAIAGAGG